MTVTLGFPFQIRDQFDHFKGYDKDNSGTLDLGKVSRQHLLLPLPLRRDMVVVIIFVFICIMFLARVFMTLLTRSGVTAIVKKTVCDKNFNTESYVEFVLRMIIYFILL